MLCQRKNEVRKIYVFYADVFLIQNFLMDLIAVTGANYFLRRHRKYRYLIGASAASSVAGLFLLLTVRDTVLYAIASHFLLNTGMVLFCFGRCGKKEFLENWTVTYFVVILLGGTMEWLLENNILSRKSLLLGIAGVFLVYGILLYLMQRRDFRNHILNAQLKKRGYCLPLKAYWDSGNQLRDPYTGQGICILSGEKAKTFFDENNDRFRLVPYCSLGENAGMLWVTDVDELLLFDGKKTTRVAHVAVGIADEGLLENREYDFILHASFL